MPVQKQPIMAKLSDPERNFLYTLFPRDLRFDETPVAERLTKEVFYIPIHPAMSDDDVNTVVSTVKKAVREVS
jgi:dTDP-4-amino-4,6-dideoxygalactose transaminase